MAQMEKISNAFWDLVRSSYNLLKKFERFPGQYKTLDDFLRDMDKLRIEQKNQKCIVDEIDSRWFCPYSAKYENKNVFLNACSYSEISQTEHPTTHKMLLSCTNFAGNIKVRHIKEKERAKESLLQFPALIFSKKARLKRMLDNAISKEKYEKAAEIHYSLY